MLFPREVVLKSHFTQIMRGEFGYEVVDSHMINDCSVNLQPQVGNIRVYLELNFADRLSSFIRSEYPRGRSGRQNTLKAITRGRISSRIANVLLSTLMGSSMPLQCRI